MRRNTNFQLGMPRFSGAVRGLVLLSSAIYGLLLLLRLMQPDLAGLVLALGALSPVGIGHHWYWQFLTYGFLHHPEDPLNLLLSMLAVYFIGSAVQDRIGSRAFVEMYLISVVGAGILGYVLSFTGFAQGAAMGSGPAANAILMVFFLLFRDTPIFVFPVPIPIPTKYVVIFTGAIEGVYFLLSHSLFNAMLLLGLLVGFLWFRLLWHRKSLVGAVEDQVFGFRNAYYKWKRRRAGKKFEVDMRKYDKDRYFDQYGNYREPDPKDKKDNGENRGPWVN
jgi:membrane associated rhomboid family serine protease